MPPMPYERIPPLPGAISWQVPPADSDSSQPGEISITAGPLSDLFSNPGGGKPQANSPRGLASPGQGDLIFSSRVRVGFAATFDAGVLLIWQDEDSWAKLCFEYSPQGQPMIVSVVTRVGVSDDCNSVAIGGNSVYLRLARVGNAFAFHYSLDGDHWHFVRHFSLARPDQVTIGLSVQSPRGQGCTATFSSMAFARMTLADLRSGV